MHHKHIHKAKNTVKTHLSNNMKGSLINHVNGISLRTFELQNKSRRLLPGPSNSCSKVESQTLKQSAVHSVVRRMNKLGKTMKGKLSFGPKILEPSRVDNVFMRVFGIEEGEKLLKASKCCLYTTTGPIEGLLFVSTERLAFCSDKPILQFSSSNGESLGFHYKVMIPIGKIRRVHQSENIKRPSQKYLQVVTTDNHEFWFIEFQNYKRTFRLLQHAISRA